MSDFLDDLHTEKTNRENQDFLHRLADSAVDFMTNVMTLAKISRFFLRHSEDIILLSNTNDYYANHPKFKSVETFERHKHSLMAEADVFQTLMVKSASLMEANNDVIVDTLLKLIKVFS